MQNFNPNSDEHNLNAFNHQFTNSGQGNLPGQMSGIPNQPTIIRPEQPVQKVEQAQTFEKPTPQQRSLRPVQNPVRQAQTTVQKKPAVAAASQQTSSKEEQITQIFEEIESLKNQTKRPGALTRIEKLLRQVLDLNS